MFSMENNPCEIEEIKKYILKIQELLWMRILGRYFNFLGPA